MIGGTTLRLPQMGRNPLVPLGELARKSSVAGLETRQKRGWSGEAITVAPPGGVPEKNRPLCKKIGRNLSVKILSEDRPVAWR